MPNTFQELWDIKSILFRSHRNVGRSTSTAAGTTLTKADEGTGNDRRAYEHCIPIVIAVGLCLLSIVRSPSENPMFHP